MDQHIEKASTRTRLLPVFFSAAERSILSARHQALHRHIRGVVAFEADDFLSNDEGWSVVVQGVAW
jgi:hypothetical protein